MAEHYLGECVYVVVAPMVLAYLRDGTSVTVLRGQLIPENIKPGHLDHLLTLELVQDRDEPAGGPHDN